MLKKGFVIVMAMVTLNGLMPLMTAYALDELAPYDRYAAPQEVYNGAMLDLNPTGNADTWVKNELANMKTNFNINTVNLYGLENFSARDTLFSELKKLGMQAVVRIEAYSSSFAFQVTDLEWIMTKYSDLLDFACAAGRREQVAYFSLNMPVDDGNVHKNLGGSINSELSKQRQVTYAAAFVARMRQETAARGYSGAKQFLSIFYGWDNSYDLPSYVDSGADGYFMNNYSYPKSNSYIPDENASDDDLINKARLSVSVGKYRQQYPGKPLVVEFGFHTVEYNNGVKPNQTAGLVKNKAAKIRAIRATIAYYRTVPEFRGALYFGYNLYKQEGNPSAVMDWTLKYSSGSGTTAPPPSTTTSSSRGQTTGAPAGTQSAAAVQSTVPGSTAGGTTSTEASESTESRPPESSTDGQTTASAPPEQTAAATQPPKDTGGSGGLSIGAQLAIGAGVLLVLGGGGAAGVWWYLRKKGGRAA